MVFHVHSKKKTEKKENTKREQKEERKGKIKERRREKKLRTPDLMGSFFFLLLFPDFSFELSFGKYGITLDQI